jgi:hypothetical protein
MTTASIYLEFIETCDDFLDIASQGYVKYMNDIYRSIDKLTLISEGKYKKSISENEANNLLILIKGYYCLSSYCTAQLNNLYYGILHELVETKCVIERIDTDIALHMNQDKQNYMYAELSYYTCLHYIKNNIKKADFCVEHHLENNIANKLLDGINGGLYEFIIPENKLYFIKNLENSLQVTIKIYKNGSNVEQNFEVKISKNDLYKIKTEVKNEYQINYSSQKPNYAYHASDFDLKNVFPSEPYNRKNLNKFYKKNTNNSFNSFHKKLNENNNNLFNDNISNNCISNNADNNNIFNNSSHKKLSNNLFNENISNNSISNNSISNNSRNIFKKVPSINSSVTNSINSSHKKLSNNLFNENISNNSISNNISHKKLSNNSFDDEENSNSEVTSSSSNDSTDNEEKSKKKLSL